MKQLTVIRHAKSSWDHPELSDHDRPLAPPGIADAHVIGDYLYEDSFSPDAMIASTSTRTQETAHIIANRIGFPIDQIVGERSFYVFGDDGSVILTHLLGRADSIKHIVVFGHNDTLRRLVLQLSQGEIVEFPTCAVASFVYEIDTWSGLTAEPYPTLDFSVSPKLLR